MKTSIATKLGFETVWDSLYAYAVTGHIPRSKVIRSHVVRWAQIVKFTLFGKLEPDCNRTWFIDIMYRNLHVFMRSEGQRSREVNFKEPGKKTKQKTCDPTGVGTKSGVHLQHSQQASGLGTVKYSFLFL